MKFNKNNNLTHKTGKPLWPGIIVPKLYLRGHLNTKQTITELLIVIVKFLLWYTSVVVAVLNFVLSCIH
jgi:hypothetical protein